MPGLFRNPKDPDNVAITRLVKTWTAEVFELPADTVVSVSEINCMDPACPGTETHIMILYANKETSNFSIGKPLTYIRRWDVEVLLIHRK